MSLHDLEGSRARTRRLSLGLCVPVYALVVLGFLVANPWAAQGSIPGAAREAREARVALVDLADPAPRTPPVLVPRGDPASLHPEEPMGGGNSRGTGTVDPRLLERPSAALVTNLPPPAVPATPELLPTRQAPLVIDRSLPLAPGGTGLPRGKGQGFGTGSGDGIGPGRGGGAVPVKEDISILEQVTPEYRLKPGDDAVALAAPVTVRMVVGADGVPLEARATWGPGQLREEAARVARLWRWRVPASLRGEAPFRFTITFYFRLDVHR